jgi:hypothetical protein
MTSPTGTPRARRFAEQAQVPPVPAWSAAQAAVEPVDQVSLKATLAALGTVVLAERSSRYALSVELDVGLTHEAGGPTDGDGDNASDADGSTDGDADSAGRLSAVLGLAASEPLGSGDADAPQPARRIVATAARIDIRDRRFMHPPPLEAP